jgi:hypothetical protein
MGSIDDLKARLDRLLAEYSRPMTGRDQMSALQAALVDLKVGIKDLRDALHATEREAAAERELLETTERRGRLAGEIGDSETAEIAGRFAATHRERLDVLSRKLAVQKDELALAEREYAALVERFRAARQGLPGEPLVPGAAPDPDALRAETDQRAVEAVVDAQLQELKKKMGKRASP